MPCKHPEPEDLFECRQCGECCRGYGGTYLTEADIEKISAYTGIPRRDLIEKYCIASGKRYVLRQKDDGYCVFWDGACTIHPVKPRMCMAWPFIENLLSEPSNWESMAESCPGMRTGFEKKDVVRCVKEKLRELYRYRNDSTSYIKTGVIS
ncbi:MAG: YkgJ family cysteine cluster protein [Thermodesulfobacteriota bacterium]